MNDSKLVNGPSPQRKREPVQHSYAICPFTVKIKHLGLNILLSVPYLCISGVLSGSLCNSPSLDPKKHTHTTAKQ